jgi:hypothetical protein
MALKKLPLCLLGAALAASVLTTGCQPQADPVQTTTQPAPSQPATNETVIYNKWETETHRPHKEINQRTVDEQKEYNDWKQKQPDHH